jgi:hypothetical protein
MVLPYCRARLGRQQRVIRSAEDVAQDICLAVLTALARYQVRGLSFRAFVYGIAAHKVIDAFRAAGRDRSEPMAEVDDAAVDHDGPEQRVLQPSSPSGWAGCSPCCPTESARLWCCALRSGSAPRKPPRQSSPPPARFGCSSSVHWLVCVLLWPATSVR